VRRLVTFAVAWLLAAVAATTAAWQGVALVTHEVTDERPAALGASDIEAALDDASDTSIMTTSSATASATTSATGAGAGSGSTSTTAGTPGTSGTGPVTTTRPSGSGTTTTTALDAVAETHTYTLIGGTTTLRFSPAGVSQVVSTPNPGFEVKTEPEGGGLRVEFESDSHRSRIDAWWDDGPRVRPREDPR
jgi:hypothetical protein